MKRGILNDVMWLLLIGTLLLGGGYFVARWISSSDVDLSYKVSFEQEAKMGELFHNLIMKEYKVMEDNAADSGVQQVSARLIAALDSTPYRYRIIVLKSKGVNAFTIPGGNIYVFSGLLDLTESPEELAAVLSHEMGHAEKRHVVSRLVKEISISLLLSSATGGDPGVAAQAFKQILGSTFDREQESEADQFGLGLLEKSKVSPKSMAKFFERLNAKDLDYDENLEILMSHPHNNKRIEQTKRYKTKNGFEPKSFDIDWAKVKKTAAE